MIVMQIGIGTFGLERYFLQLLVVSQEVYLLVKMGMITVCPPSFSPFGVTACSLERCFTCSPCFSSFAQLCVASYVPSVSAGHCGLSLTQRRLRVMNNATGRLVPESTAQSLGFLRNSARTWETEQQPTKGSEEVGWEKKRDGGGN